jgi:NADH dehydrogenase
MNVILAEVVSVDVNARRVIMVDGQLDYDFLILATGARHSYFGHPEWERFAPGLKSLEDAVEIRRRILMAFEFAEKTNDEAARKAAMTFVVVGGGPTGVEMAGAIAEIARYTLARDFRRIDPSQARIIVIEGEPCVLASFPEDLQQKAAQQLRDLGVELRTGVQVARREVWGRIAKVWGILAVVAAIL